MKELQGGVEDERKQAEVYKADVSNFLVLFCQLHDIMIFCRQADKANSRMRTVKRNLEESVR